MNQRSEMNIDVSLYVAKAALATTAVPFILESIYGFDSEPI